LNKYYGSYYEMYTDDIVEATLERGTYCSVTTYSAQSDGTVGFRSSENRSSEWYCRSCGWIHGRRHCPNRYVRLAYSQCVTQRTIPYWALAVGPLDNHGLYSYIIMSGSTGLTMWVLARNFAEFNSKYDSEAQVLLENMG